MYLEINATKRSRDGARKAPVLRAHGLHVAHPRLVRQSSRRSKWMDGQKVQSAVALLHCGHLQARNLHQRHVAALGQTFLMIYTTLCPQGGPKARKGCCRTAAEMGNYFPSSRTADGTGRLRLEDSSSQDAESEKVFEIVSAKFAKAQVQNGADGGRTSRMIVGCFWRSLVSAHGCLGARKPVRNTWQAIGTSDACRT